MTKPPPKFEVRESRVDGSLRLSVSGELDLASAPDLEARLASVRVTKLPVRLDLSQLEFIDSTGIHLLIRELGEARAQHRELQIEPDLSAQVRRLFKLVHLEHVISGVDGDGAGADGAGAAAGAGRDGDAADGGRPRAGADGSRDFA